MILLIFKKNKACIFWIKKSNIGVPKTGAAGRFDFNQSKNRPTSPVFSTKMKIIANFGLFGWILNRYLHGDKYTNYSKWIYNDRLCFANIAFLVKSGLKPEWGWMSLNWTDQTGSEIEYSFSAHLTGH